MKERIYFVLIGLLSAWLGAAAETDTRTEVTEVIATCTPDIASIVGYGKTKEKPTFAVSEGSVANIRNSDFLWQKKNPLHGKWEGYYEPLFLEGEYRARIDVRIDSAAGETHKLAENWTLTVNGQQWTTDAPIIAEDWCYGLAYSPEIVVTKETGQPISELTVSGLIEPVNGQKPEDTASLGEYAIICDCEWKVYDENTESWDYMNYDEYAYTDSFEKGKKYMYSLEAISKAGYEFAPNIRVLYNGVELPDYDENIETPYSSKFISEERHRLEINLYFENVNDKTEIQELTLTGVTRPVVGEMPNDEASLGDKVDIVFKCWSVRNESDGDWDSMLENGKYDNPFEEGKEYLFMLHALPKEGYSFAPDLKVIYASTEIPDYTEGANTGKGILKGVEGVEDGLLIVSLHQDSMISSSADIKLTEFDASADVYNLLGVRVKRNATEEDIHSLPAGIYITHGKKIIVK